VHAGIEGARRHGVAVVVGRTDKDVTERVVCGVCWIFLREGEGISMREWLGGGKREWIEMAGGSGYRDTEVIYTESGEDIHPIPLFPCNTTLTFVRSVPAESVP
jgi:hypothetical protein